MTEEEYAEFAERLSAYNMSQAEFIRQAITGATIRPIITAVSYTHLCTNRKPLPGMETLEPFNIIYQTAEDGLGDTVKPRLMEAEADLERVLVIDDRDTPLTLAAVSYTHLRNRI